MTDIRATVSYSSSGILDLNERDSYATIQIINNNRYPVIVGLSVNSRMQDAFEYPTNGHLIPPRNITRFVVRCPNSDALKEKFTGRLVEQGQDLFGAFLEITFRVNYVPLNDLPRDEDVQNIWENSQLTADQTDLVDSVRLAQNVKVKVVLRRPTRRESVMKWLGFRKDQ